MVASSARWIATAQVVRIAGQLIGMAVLARLLAPSDYGLMAMVSAVVTLAMLLRDMGTGSAVIQKAELDEQTTAAVFWFNVLTGLVLLLITAVSAPLIAWGFRSPALTELMLLASVAFPLSSVGSVHQALLERRSAFRTLARIEIVATVLALLIAVLLAYQGAGVYSLVAQTVAAATIATIQLFTASGWRPRGKPQWGRLRSLMGFTGGLVGFNLINYVARNADTMVIGRFLGAAALGAYSLAYKLMLFPLQNLTFVVTRALFPALSRQQHDVPAMSDLYFRAVTVLAMLTAPLMAGATVLREPLIALVFGPKWSTSAAVLLWLAPTGFVQSIVSTVGTVLMARGRTDLLLRLGLFSTGLYVLAFAIGLPHGVTGVALCYFVANVVNAIPCFYIVTRQLDCRPTRMLRALAPSVLMALMMSCVLALSLRYLTAGPVLGWPGFLGFALGGAVLYGVLMKWVVRQDMRDIVKLLKP